VVLYRAAPFYRSAGQLVGSHVGAVQLGAPRVVEDCAQSRDVAALPLDGPEAAAVALVLDGPEAAAVALVLDGPEAAAVALVLDGPEAVVSVQGGFAAAEQVLGEPPADVRIAQA
jgi:hypothetical protein